jgi:hypothetical protein
MPADDFRGAGTDGAAPPRKCAAGAAASAVRPRWRLASPRRTSGVSVFLESTLLAYTILIDKSSGAWGDFTRPFLLPEGCPGAPGSNCPPLLLNGSPHSGCAHARLQALALLAGKIPHDGFGRRIGARNRGHTKLLRVNQKPAQGFLRCAVKIRSGV